MFVTNWISPTKIQKISEITNFFRHYFLSRTEVGCYNSPDETFVSSSNSSHLQRRHHIKKMNVFGKPQEQLVSFQLHQPHF